jgi:LysR family transcriptional regulator, low CO2-responsive transcriptional regulator
MTEQLQLPHLETFSKAAELSSFTAAAKTLRLSQAAVSQRVQALEKILKTPLFKRQGGRVLLTDAGQSLYEFSERILDLHREARRAITGRQTTVTGELVLAASSIPGEHLLPALLSTFGKQHPHIRTRVTVSDSVEVTSQVEHGTVALGLVGRKINSPNLIFRYLASDRMLLVVPRGHPLGKRKKVPLKELPRYPLVLREAGSGLRHCFEKALERTGRSLSDLQVALEFGSNEAIKEAVLRRVGVAILSIYAVQKELTSGDLQAVEVTGLRCDRDMFVVRDKRRVLPIAARLFLAFLETHPVAPEFS